MLLYLIFCVGLVSCSERGGFACDGDKCLSSAWVCDGDRDCMDGADEAECKGNNTIVEITFIQAKRTMS